MAYPLPDKPSIVVLPFNNMSDDPEQEYFSDGITEDLITDLSQISGIFVIGRNSTFTYKGKPFKFRQIAEDLGVRYVLEGSVRRNEDMVRINAQLIDTITGGYLWATRYDEKMGNLFSLQDKVTRKIVEVLAVKLTIDEMEAIPKRDTESLEAYLTFLKGWQQYQQFNPDAFSEAISLFEKAIEIDPNYGRAYAALAKIYMEANKRALWCEHLGITKDDCWFRRFKYMEMAMKSPNSLAHAVASGNYIATKNHNHSIAEAEIAVSLNPNDPEANYAMGNALCWAGRHKESVDFFRKAMRLDPFYKNKFGEGLGFAYFLMKRFKEAANWCKKSVDSNPENPVPLWYLIASYAHLGRQQEAEAALHELRKINPYYSNLWVVERHSHYGLKNSEDLELFLEGLSKAGMD
jgi:TolB-like protein/Flp pilus assembly protein TadD